MEIGNKAENQRADFGTSSLQMNSGINNRWALVFTWRFS